MDKMNMKVMKRNWKQWCQQFHQYQQQQTPPQKKQISSHLNWLNINKKQRKNYDIWRWKSRS